MQTFLNIRNGWDFLGTVPSDTYETMWINSTVIKAENDAQLLGKLDGGLYMFFYGVEGAGAGNDTSANPALSAVPFVVHVADEKRNEVLDNLKDDLGIITLTQYDDIKGGKVGIVAVAALSSPDEATDGYDISLLAREQLEILAKLAAGSASADAGTYSGLPVKKVAVTLENGRTINVVGAGFVK